MKIMESKDITKAVLTELFNLENPEEDNSEDLLFKQLSDHVEWLLEHNKDFLLSLLYRLDVQEAKINWALSPGNPISPSIGLAHLIIERQIQRMKTKKEYASHRFKDPDIEEW